MLGHLPVEIELGGPPGGGAVFEFHIAADESVSSRRLSHRVEKFDFEISRLFHFVGIGDEVRPFLSLASGGGEYRTTGIKEWLELS